MKGKTFKMKLKDELEIEFSENHFSVKANIDNPNIVFENEKRKVHYPRNKEKAIEIILKKIYLLTMTKGTIEFDNGDGATESEKLRMIQNPTRIALLASADTFLDMEIKKWSIRLLHLLDPEEYKDLIARGDAIYKGTNDALNNEQRYNVSIRARKSFSGLDYIMVDVDDINKRLNYRSYEDFTKHWNIKNENFKLFANYL